MENVNYLRQRGYVFVVVCLYVCLLATLRKNFPTDLHEIFSEGWQWANEQNDRILVAIRITVWIQGLFSEFVISNPVARWWN